MLLTSYNAQDAPTPKNYRPHPSPGGEGLAHGTSCRRQSFCLAFSEAAVMSDRTSHLPFLPTSWVGIRCETLHLLSTSQPPLSLQIITSIHR